MAALERSESATAGTGGVREWYWRGRALAAAKAAALKTATMRERYRRAQLAAEFADRQLAADDPLRAGSSVPLALSLYREAAYWALIANTAGPVPRTVGAALAAAETSVASSGLSSADLAVVRAALAEKTFAESADDRPEVQLRDAELCQTFVCALTAAGGDTTNVVAKLLVQRWLRIGATLVIMLVALICANVAIQRQLQGPDLALGKPWRTSSKYTDCHPQKNECGGAQTAIFFHTEDEDSPWVEIDLGKPQAFSRIEVINRDDCCLERAVPLIAEVSTDREHWREVARRADSFRTWDATFRPATARYVRLRVNRHSALHLVRVSVRAE